MFDFKKTYMHLHKNPELSREEFKTTKYLKEILSKYELEIIELEPTGLICLTKNKSSEYILFRSDIDALEITEEIDSQYKSVNKGVMHACGHDIHMTSLLKFIDEIMPRVNELNHNLIFVFQPAEEIDGGAQIVINNERLKKLNIKSSHAVHVWPELDFGVVACKEDTLFATNKVLDLTLKGKASHASTPQLASGTLQPMMDFINFTNHLIAKYSGPFEPLVINVGKINGGSAVNVVMSELKISMTIRSVSDLMILKVYEQMKNYVSNLESSYNINALLEQKEITYPTVHNDSDLFNKFKTSEMMILKNPTLAVEDFGFYKNLSPTLMFLVGTNKGENESLHSSTFLPDYEIINNISKLYSDIVNKYEED